jgi:septal ring factor EnvC (AmiA/AmiB activator)
MSELSKRIEKVTKEIDQLTKSIANAAKDESFDKNKLKEMTDKKNKLALERTRLVRQEWEETHERLDYGDDR